MKPIIRFYSAVILVLSVNTFACKFDLDCSTGSRCVKSLGSMNGVCKGGLNPGNKYDKKPVKKFGDMKKTYGNTCVYSFDCGVGGVCSKELGNIRGVCE